MGNANAPWSRAILTSILSIPLIGVSIPNVNTDIRRVREHTREHMSALDRAAASGVSRGYREKVYERRAEAQI